MSLRSVLGAGAVFGVVSFGSLLGEQTPDWVATFSAPGSEVDNPYALVVDAVGAVYVTGSSNSGVVPQGKPRDVCQDDDICRDWATVKYYREGVEAWRAPYAGPGGSTDDAYAIALDGDGNACVSGTASQAEGGKALTVVKYSPEGDELWARSVADQGGSFERALAVTADLEGNVVAAGVAIGSAPASGRLATVKYAPDGTRLWVSFYGPALLQGNAGIPRSLAVDGAGTVYVTGRTKVDGHAFDDAYVTIKYAPTGEELWARTYGSRHGSDFPAAVLADEEGNVYVTGGSTGARGTGCFATVKYDSEGTEVWVRSYESAGLADSFAEALAVDGQGDVYVAGPSAGADGRNGIATVKYSADGEELWVRRVDPREASFQSVHTLIVRSDGTSLVAGSSGNLHSVIVYSLQGELLEELQVRGPGSFAYFRGAVADSNGTIYAIGNAVSPASGVDYVTVKLSCAPRSFRRGDTNDDGAVNVSDPIWTLGVLFLGGGTLGCEDAADVNDDGVVDISDAVATLQFLFLGAEQIPAPGAETCGPDPTADGLGCASHPACE